ncbi:DKNYY domain-containing protein [Wenyingzhuangia aestuarii]|uniref:DKNYY domain-containing protein n=1 Tax=Wenyingzhuangia aestuarii TaxID=1647582 RepID=UPI00143B3F1A|nr:DKNYY domain-containing protein [Wenyingzhuangia aestuarii]NJB84172.1 hypothetical protein [Wenyingzhuangia aestuarii]
MKKKSAFKIFISLIVTLSLTGCSPYDIRDDGVYFIEWNAAQGKVEKKINRADKNSFKHISGSYGKDKNFVFFKRKIINGADSNSFKRIKRGYSIDKNRVYYYGDSITNSSSKQFEIIDNYYSKDYKDIYYRNQALNVCSVENFEFVFHDSLENEYRRWTRDGCNYFINSIKVPSSEYDNLNVYPKSGGISSDSKNVYHYNRNICYDSKGIKILDTVDIKTFEVYGFIKCRDKYGNINLYNTMKQIRLK